MILRLHGNLYKFVSRTFHLSSSIHQQASTTTSGVIVDLSQFSPKRIRNFSIIAHVDHGKSTMADRLLEMTGTISLGREPQILDKLEVERQRGITVKAQTASMFYKHNDGEEYLINLVDTPGHADFSYEVSRSLAASDGAILLVDAKQGIQAQTVANFWLAFERDLPLIPVLNKIDLKECDVAMVCEQMESMFEFNAEDCLQISAKLGTNMDSILPTIVNKIPSPIGDPDCPFRALIFDSWFLTFKGAIASIVVKDGSVTKGDTICSMNSGKNYEVQEVGIMHPEPTPVQALHCGQVGYIIAGMKTVRETLLGDTLCAAQHKDSIKVLPGFKKALPVVFAGLFPVDPADVDNLRGSLEKLALNDPAVTFEPDVSAALGQGWRMGFLGLLHMEVFGQRLDQEYEASVILTAPSVSYKAVVKDNAGIRKRYEGKSEIIIVDPSKFPPVPDIDHLLEPMIVVTIITPQQYVGPIMTLCNSKRGIQEDSGFSSLEGNRVMLKYRLPLAEIVIDFFDKLKHMSSGYASFDYEDAGYQRTDLIKLGILINAKLVEEFSTIVPRDVARKKGVELCDKLLEEIPRQQYAVIIQAVIGGKVLARKTIKAYKKDLSQKLKGNFGDRTRVQKLVKQQQEGKKRMKSIGQIQIPKEAFINVLKR